MFVYQLFPLLVNAPEVLNQRDWAASAESLMGKKTLIIGQLSTKPISSSYLEVYNMGGLQVIPHGLQNSSPQTPTLSEHRLWTSHSQDSPSSAHGAGCPNTKAETCT